MMNVTTIKESNIKLVVPYIDPISLKVFGIWTLDKINKMKIATDLEQSKKLAEFLPLESADMHYATWTILDGEFILSPNQGSTIENLQEDYGNQIIPCWSLASLFGILPKGTRLLKSITDDTYHCDCPKGNVDEWYDNPIDACVEMIIKLHEQKML